MNVAEPTNEALRMEYLRGYEILDTEPDPGLDSIVSLLSHSSQMSMALVSLVDEDRLWFKAATGVGDLREAPRENALCEHAIASNELFIVSDASEDERFRDNALVAGPPWIRFYAGAPLVVEKDIRLGTLCVLDDKPAEVTEALVTALTTLRDAVVDRLNLGVLKAQLPLNVCAWCDTIQYPETPGVIGFPVTHGICPTCRRDVRQTPDS